MRLKTLLCLSLITLVASSVLSAHAHAQTFSVIHTFTGTGGDGAVPQAGVSLRGGALFGTTWGGGSDRSLGSVYQMTRVGSTWIYTPIFFFDNSFDNLGGYFPIARVVFGPDGHLYGTTSEGGTINSGVLFDLIPPKSICRDARCTLWKENILHNFGDTGDGDEPGYGDLIWDKQGNIYGTTVFGGLYDEPAGIVFQLDPGTKTYTVIHAFSTNDHSGAYPHNGLLLGPYGDLFGTTQIGGLWNYGTVFKLTYSTDWTLFDIEDFAHPGITGAFPITGLVRDRSGNLYGATSEGGLNGGGTVFKLFPFTVLYNLQGRCGYPPGPHASLAVDSTGNLYGTTYCGGANSVGTIFKLTKGGNDWTYTLLHDFKGGDDGAHPVSTVTIDADGTLYGTAGNGGNTSCNPPQGCGVVWMIRP